MEYVTEKITRFKITRFLPLDKEKNGHHYIDRNFTVSAKGCLSKSEVLKGK